MTLPPLPLPRRKKKEGSRRTGDARSCDYIYLYILAGDFAAAAAASYAHGRSLHRPISQKTFAREFEVILKLPILFYFYCCYIYTNVTEKLYRWWR